MKEITTEANIESIPKIISFVNDELDCLACPRAIKLKIGIVLDEILANISMYAYRDSGQVTVRIEACSESENITIEFVDNGVPYNPLESVNPDTTLPLDERKIGGLGIFIVKKIVDSLEYRYDNRHRQNILTIKKKIPRF